ncbi:hypothetical protein [Xanthomonas albilineans]|nr:hypothetical protein [Xanthomonas albilineans]
MSPAADTPRQALALITLTDERDHPVRVERDSIVTQEARMH